MREFAVPASIVAAPSAPSTARLIVRGTGSIGQRHLRLARETPDLDVVAFPIRPERVTELRVSGTPTIASVDELRAFSDAVVGSIIATDTGRHLDDARELMRFGDVLIEKPLAPSLDGVDLLQRDAVALGRRAFVAYPLRFDRSLQRFAARLPEIGCVSAVRIECQSFLPDWRPGTDYRRAYSARADEGGVLRDLAHELDYATLLFGRPREVFCTLSNSGRLAIEAEESADVIWRAPNGAIVTLRLDYLTRPGRRRMRADGESGSLEWDGIAGAVVRTHSDGRVDRELVGIKRDEAIVGEIRAFVAAMKGGSAGPLATLEEGSYLTALADSARESSRSARSISIPAWMPS